jgi:hypothetical protein
MMFPAGQKFTFEGIFRNGANAQKTFDAKPSRAYVFAVTNNIRPARKAGQDNEYLI